MRRSIQLLVHLSRGRAVVSALCGVTLLLVLSGCMINNVPRFKYGPDGEKIQFKRYEKHLNMDFVNHITPIAYKRTDALPLGATISTDQDTILAKMGKPEYMRNDYLAESREVATDWLYYEKDRLYQFVEGELVYEGPLTDYDRTLVTRGRPHYSDSPTDEFDRRWDVFRYQNKFTNTFDELSFMNGKLIGQMEQ